MKFLKDPKYRPRKLLLFYLIIIFAVLSSFMAWFYIVKKVLQNHSNQNDIFYSFLRENYATFDALYMIGVFGVILGLLVLMVSFFKPGDFIAMDDPGIPKEIGEREFKKCLKEFDFDQYKEYYRRSDLTYCQAMQKQFRIYLAKIRLLDPDHYWTPGNGFKINSQPKTEEQKAALEFINNARSILYYNQYYITYLGFAIIAIIHIFLMPFFLIMANPASWINWLFGIASLIFFAINFILPLAKISKISNLMAEAKAILGYTEVRHYH